MTKTLEVGDLVEDKNGERIYIGKVMTIDGVRCYVRWHKGYASWKDVSSLRRVVIPE